MQTKNADLEIAIMPTDQAAGIPSFRGAQSKAFSSSECWGEWREVEVGRKQIFLSIAEDNTYDIYT